MASVGFSPPTRVFEAAGAGACVITDAWEGIETFFRPGQEVLVAKDAEDVVRYLHKVTAPQARCIGAGMRRRALREHTYQLRALQFNSIMRGGVAIHAGPVIDARERLRASG
jgi:spore maturation protein CgeB